MQRRSFFLSGLAALCSLAPVAMPTAAKAHVGNGMEPIRLDDLAEVQYGPRGQGRRRRRCRLVVQRVFFTDRFGRQRVRYVEREICR